MKNVFCLKVLVLSLLALLLSCEALPVNYSKSQSWSIPNDKPGKPKPTLTLLNVQVDRTGGWDSIEKESTALAQLFFWNKGYRVVPVIDEPAYAVEINVREREFNRGWRTKRSLAVEVRIWVSEDAPVNGAPVNEQKLPVAVGRVIAMGDKSFSSSETISRLLSKAVEKAAKQLAVHVRKNKNA